MQSYALSVPDDKSMSVHWGKVILDPPNKEFNNLFNKPQQM